MAQERKKHVVSTNLRASKEHQPSYEMVAITCFALGGGTLGALFGYALSREPLAMVIGIAVGGALAGYSQYNNSLGRFINYGLCCLLTPGYINCNWSPPSGFIRFYAAVGACFGSLIVALIVISERTAWGDFFRTALKNPFGFIVGALLASVIYAWRGKFIGLLENQSISNIDKLVKAASDGNLLDVEGLLAKGVNINGRGRQNDFTALMAASFKGHLEVVNALLSHGAEVNKREQLNDATPLMVSAQQGHLEILRALIDASADITTTNAYGVSPLAFAARKGHTHIVKELLKKGAKVNSLTLDGRTPLMSAAQVGHLDVVKILVANGADVNIKSEKGYTAVRYASEWGRRDVFKFLEACNA